MKPMIFARHLFIPAGTDKIRARAYEKNLHVCSVTVPGTVKTIESRAFADCANLKSITLCEGVERIESNVFTGCKQLKSIHLPASVKQITGWAFYGSGLQEAVLGASGRILVFCPPAAAGTEYTIPANVREIGMQAFAEQPDLQGVVLPEGLETIRERAFIECGFQEISLPESIKLVETGAFFHCRKLKVITGLPQQSCIENTIEFWRMKGETFPVMLNTAQPPTQHWKDPDFREIAAGCAAGNPDTMYRMMEFFDGKALEHANVPFYERARNFWMYRAYQYGNPKAKDALERWIVSHPNYRLSIPPLSNQLGGVLQGQLLNALGFLNFEENEEYIFQGLDSDGIVLVRKYESEDGPDEDGFGMETYYDWWFMDEYLNSIPEAPCLHSYSTSEFRAPTAQKRFLDAHYQTVQILQKKRQGSC